MQLCLTDLDNLNIPEHFFLKVKFHFAYRQISFAEIMHPKAQSSKTTVIITGLIQVNG